MIKICLICNKSFRTFPNRIKKNCGKYCSRKCFHSTEKNIVPWNKGKHYTLSKNSLITKNCLVCDKIFQVYPCYKKQKYCSSECYGKTLIGKPHLGKLPPGFISPLKGRKRPNHSGEKAYNWKGNDAKYIAKHAKIYRQKGKPIICLFCKRPAKHWANIDHKYSRDPNDYISLCVPCHRLYDYHILSFLKLN